MKAGKYLVLALASAVLLGGAGCKKKKPNLPPQTQPPTITQPQPETPPVEPQPEPTPPVTTPPTTQPEPEPAPPTPKPKPHAKKKKTTPAPTENASKPSAAKPSSASKPAAEAPASKPNDNVQISAELPQNVASQRRQQTEDLLNTAELNLKRVNRTLTDGEQSMQRQVRNFITQSRLAIQDGDFERAYTLATKAQQLSQELAK